MKRNALIIALSLFLMLVGNVFAQQRVRVDVVTNTFDSGNKLVAGAVHRFDLRVTNNVPLGGGCETRKFHPNNAVRISSPSVPPATWNYTKANLTPAFIALGWSQTFSNIFNDGVAPSVAQGDGQNTNEVQFAAFTITERGLRSGDDLIAYQVEIQSNLGDAGKSICLDSIGVSPMGTWVWAAVGASSCNVKPTFENQVGSDQTPPFCWLIEVPPNFPPAFVDCPQVDVTGSHCAVITRDIVISDAEGDAIVSATATLGTVQIIDPSTTPAGGGLIRWSYTPTLADVGASLSTTIEVFDAFGGSDPDCTFGIVVTNVGPTISCPAGPVTIQSGQTLTQDVNATDDCDVLTFFINSENAAGAVNINPATGVVDYTPVDADAGLQVMNIGVTDGLDTAYCDIRWNVILGAPYVVSLSCDTVLQGKYVDVFVTLEAVDPDPVEGGIGGFDLLIAYDASALSFISAMEGQIYADCGWEYFTYRFGANGNCSNSCPTGLLRIVGIRELNDGPAHADCDYLTLPVTLAKLTFLGSNDRTLECQFIPIRFYWVDCGDNILSNKSGSRALLSSNVYEPTSPDPINDGGATLPTYLGAPNICIVSDKDTTERGVDFYNGCIRFICGDEIDARGDINTNGLAYEIADAVMFTNYFIIGLGAFDGHVEASIAASDANADGLVLSVADLVYLIRVIVGDALPYPKVVAEKANYTYDNGVISVDGPLMGAALVTVRGNVEPKLLVDMDMKYGYNEAAGTTNILVYSLEAKGFTGEFLNVSGDVVSIDVAAYDATPITLTNVPANYALDQNYPNPFNPTTTIRLALPKAGDYTVTVYNITGQVVAEFSGTAEAGVVSIEWDAKALASGVYFYKAVVGEEFVATKKAVLIK